MAAKIQIKNDSVRNFGGFFSFVDHFRNDGLDIIVDKALGNRDMPAKHSNSDISLSLAAIYLTGGSCIEDSNRLSRNFTEISQGYRFCSADTILRLIKEGKDGLRTVLEGGCPICQREPQGILHQGYVVRQPFTTPFLFFLILLDPWPFSNLF